MIAGRDATLAEIGQLTVGKVSRRLLPLLFVLYVVCYLDRANVAFAKLPMNADLGFSDSVFGLGAGLFFLRYAATEAAAVFKWVAIVMILIAAA